MNRNVSRVVESSAFIPVITGLVGLGTGFAIGRYLQRRSMFIHELPGGLELHFTEEELAEMRELASAQGKTVDVVVLDEETQAEEPLVVQEPAAVESSTIEIISVEEAETTMVRRTIFAQNNETWDMEAELASRTPDRPYVIHQDEFYNTEVDYAQLTYTYYNGDNILVDQNEVPIYNWKDVIGELRFGHGAEHDNVFHVRNDKRKEEYEIIFDEDHYAVAVLNLESEDLVEQATQDIRHSATRMRRER